MYRRLSNLQFISKPCTRARSYGQHNKKHYYKADEVKYGSGRLRYYPRENASAVEEPANPTKLFKVQRIKSMKHNPYWENYILNELGLGKKMSDVAIVKNIPEVNAKLWKVKHLVQIEPIVFPYGEPTENDINHTVLKENGECIVTKEIQVDEARLNSTEQFKKDVKRLDGETLRKDSRLKWLNPW